MPDRMTPAARISFAQDFFRFAYRIGSPISFGLKFEVPDPPQITIFGKHSLSAEDLEMSDDAFGLCGTLLERLAYRLLAMELNSALEKKFGKWETRSSHSDDLIRNSSIVIWHIRNCVAHNILDPVWNIKDSKLQNQRISVADVLVFDTTGLDGKPLNRFDFGGPIALFRLSERLLPLLS
jgi:hypothetical protein